MGIRLPSLIAGLLVAGAVLAAPPQAAQPSTSKAPAAVVKPCPQHAMHHGQRPCPGMTGEAMPCPGMQGGGSGPMAGGCPGMQAPAAGTKPASRGAQQVFGRQLMTPEERAAYRAKLRAAKSDQERAAIREEHHKQMLERAKQRGATLPDDPPAP